MGIIVRRLIGRTSISLQQMTKGKTETDNHALGQRIRAKRLHMGWSQERLAFEANLDRSYVGAVERGERNISFTTLCRMARALKCDVGSLTRGFPSV